MDELRIAVIGNRFASVAQLPALRAIHDEQPHRVIGIAGASRAKAQTTAGRFGIEIATDDYRELLALDPQLVLITTPVHLHHRMVLDVCERTEAAILCEKPFAVNVEQAREMVAAASGRGAWIDHQLRWSPVRAELRRRLAAGSIGELWHVAMDYTLGRPAFRAREWSWWYDAERGGGSLGAIGSHMIDLLRSELGEVREVCAALETVVKKRVDAEGEERAVTADDHATLSLRFASGVRADLVTSSAAAHARGFYTRYTGSEGTLVIEAEERLLEMSAHDREAREVGPPLPESESVGMPAGGSPFERTLPSYLASLLGAVRSGSTSVPGAASFADGLATQAVLDTARASNRAGSRWTPIDP